MGYQQHHRFDYVESASSTVGDLEGEGSCSLFKGEPVEEFSGSGELNAINHYGVSETLIGLFNDLRELSGLGGNGTKFRHDDIDKLERAIVYRNYGKNCLELAHLLAAVLQKPPMRPGQSILLEFFWFEQNVTPQRARCALADIKPKGKNRIQVGEQFIELNWGDSAFSISPSRMGFLSALLEFAQFADPTLIIEAQEKLANPTEKAIQAFSSWIQKRLFEFLGPHMVPAQLRRRLRVLIDWYKQNADQAPSMEDYINDEVVFAFWQHWALDDEGLGFRKLSTVADDFITALKALEIGRGKSQALTAVTIGMDVETGEWHPEQLAEHIEEVGLDAPDLTFMEKQIKFFPNARWVGLCEALIYRGSISLKLPLTCVRVAVLGSLQDKLIQALKDKNHDVFNQCLQGKTESDYGAHLSELDQFAVEIEQARLLGLGLFLMINSEDALGLIAELMPPAALENLKAQWLGDAEDIDIAAHELLEKLPELRLSHPELNRLCQDALNKFKKTARAGFAELPEEQGLADYQYGLELIAESRRLRDAYVACLKTQCNLDFENDLGEFTKSLNRIYGEKL